jgi:hypothetical protein
MEERKEKMEKRGDRRTISDLKFEISKVGSAERIIQIPPPTLVGSSSVPMDRVRYRDSGRVHRTPETGDANGANDNGKNAA